MRTLAGVAWCSAIVFVAGCASSGVSIRSWLGRTETDLVTAWGRPATTESDGQGGRILTYYAVTDWVANNDDATVQRAAGLVREPDGGRGDPPKSRDDLTANVTVRESRQRSFWVDATGTIYSCSWQSPPGLFGRSPKLNSASLRNG